LGLGEAENDFIYIPKQLSVTEIDQIACGSQHAIFKTINGNVLTCGNGEYGQLGHGYNVLSCSEPKLNDFLKKVKIVNV